MRGELSATAAVLADEAAKPPAPGGGDFVSMMVFPLIAIMFMYYFIVARPEVKQRQSRESMLKNLKKNDRVLTIGGIIGTVANISQDGKEVTLKVDDNTRLRFTRESIQRVLSEEPPPVETAAT